MTTCCSAALFLLLITFFIPLSAVDNIVEVRYSREPISGMEGQPLTLKCTVVYNEMQCGDLKGLWCLDSSNCFTNPNKHLIHINETKLIQKPGFRQRDVFLHFKQLSITDSGSYQCIGTCGSSGLSAMGRFLELSVTENLNKDQVTDLSGSGRCSADVALLLVMGFALPWISQMLQGLTE